MLHDPEGDVVEVHAVHAGTVVNEGEDEVEEDGDDDGEPVVEGLEKSFISKTELKLNDIHVHLASYDNVLIGRSNVNMKSLTMPIGISAHFALQSHVVKV